MSKIRILLVDDHAVVREGLKSLIESEPDMEVVADAPDGQTALELVATANPDVAVLDLSLPDMSGAQVAAQIHESHPQIKMLALTLHEDSGYLRMMLDVGANGYVLKRAAAAELVQAIRSVSAGGTYIDPSLAGNLFNGHNGTPHSEVPTAELSERETEVMKMIARGYSNKEIASKLKLSVKTIETYKMRSMEKLQMRSRVEIVRYAALRGWLAPSYPAAPAVSLP
jgi:two-component system, NarL family, response regulator NreC